MNRSSSHKVSYSHRPRHQHASLFLVPLPLYSQLLTSRSKTGRSCGLLWNAILSLWLSPQDFRPADIGEGVDSRGGECGWGLPLGEHHGRIYAKACEVSDGWKHKDKSTGSVIMLGFSFISRDASQINASPTRNWQITTRLKTCITIEKRLHFPCASPAHLLPPVSPIPSYNSPPPVSTTLYNASHHALRKALLDAVDATHENSGGGGGARRGADSGGDGRSDGGSNPDNADDMSGHQQGNEFKVHGWEGRRLLEARCRWCESLFFTD